MEILKGANGLYFLATLLTVVAVLEWLMPWRRVTKIDFARWVRNGSMSFYGFIILGLVPFVAGYGGAVAAQERGFGLFNQVGAPFWVELAATLIVFDILSYGQHRILHRRYIFWRAHRVHHSDKHIDVSTSLRFHPFETLFRATLEAGVVWVCGLPPEGILLNFFVLSLFNTITHANIALPAPVDRVLSSLFVTPNIHRLHHSMSPNHQNTNFGTIFTLWDRLFGTYCAARELRQKESFGVEASETNGPESFANLALDPFFKPVDNSIGKGVLCDADAETITINAERRTAP